jgi:hypothetical protein
MKKFQCPYCKKYTISPLKKAIAGSPAKKGTPCPECGRNVVNGKGYVYFQIVCSLLMAVTMIFIYVYNWSLWWCPLVLLVGGLLPHLAALVFFKTEATMRIDA